MNGPLCRRIAVWPVWVQTLAAALIGGAGALGQAPYDWPVFTLAMLAFGLLLAQGAARPFIAGWALGAGYFAHTLIWILQPFLVEADRFGWLALPALILMAGGLAVFWGLAFAGARRLGLGALGVVVGWTLAELARAYVFTGFPWGAPVQALVGRWGGQGLAWAGPHGVMFLMMALAWGLGQGQGHKIRIISVIGAALLLWPFTASNPPLTDNWVRIVQPNAIQSRKWHPDWTDVFFDRQLSLSAADGLHRPDLIVWPETAVPWPLGQSAKHRAAIAAAAQGAPVVLGLLRWEGFRVFNTLAVLDRGGQVSETYDKHHLVPFTEYIPLGWISNYFGLGGVWSDRGFGFAAGAGAKLVDLGAVGLALPLICYEAVFAQDVNAAPGRARLIVQITNDAWFGERAGPQQHLALARMRAIEQGLPLVRAANTGISAMVGPQGQVLQALGQGQAGFLDAPLPAPRAPTLYSRLGDGPIGLVLVLMLAGAAIGRAQRLK